jgi:MoaA/NifB/PqqE/SkfB family radical SAM enzyme
MTKGALKLFHTLRGDDHVGLHAQRSSLKVLNHLPTLAAREKAARLLGVGPGCEAAWRHEVATLLGAFHEWTVRHAETARRPNDYESAVAETGKVISGLAELAQLYNGATTQQIRAALAEFHTVSHVEAHATDACNQRCSGCTYMHDIPHLKPPPVSFPFWAMSRLANLQPRAVTLAGGGEPLLYASQGAHFDEYVATLRRLLPDTFFGLVTNGTRPAAISTFEQFHWIRVSIDAASKETYEAFRKTEHFEAVVDRVIWLLKETKVKSVGAGFVFCKANHAEAPAFARLLFDRALRECPHELERLTVAYRPLRNDSTDPTTPFPELLDESDVEQTSQEFLDIADADPELERFLRKQTNCWVLSGGNTHRAETFQSCGYSTIFHLIRANGDVRPCCMRLDSPDFYLGNILWDPPDVIALNTLWNAAYLKSGCTAAGCKLSSLNATIEAGLNGKIPASTAPLVANDPFFG